MDKRKNIILIAIVISTIVFLVGSSFAYFTVLKVAMYSEPVKVTSATMNTLTLESGKPIYIHANEENFGKGMGSLKDETYVLALLKTGTDNNFTSYSYNINLIVNENNFEYSSLNKEPELLLKITDPTGKELKESETLNYVTVGEHSGFDITTVVGNTEIISDFTISATDSTEHKWNFEIIFVNLNDAQDLNRGKKFDGQLYIEPSN